MQIYIPVILQDSFSGIECINPEFQSLMSLSHFTTFYLIFISSMHSLPIHKQHFNYIFIYLYISIIILFDSFMAKPSFKQLAISVERFSTSLWTLAKVSWNLFYASRVYTYMVAESCVLVFYLLIIYFIKKIKFLIFCFKYVLFYKI